MQHYKGRVDKIFYKIGLQTATIMLQQGRTWCTAQLPLRASVTKNQCPSSDQSHHHQGENPVTTGICICPPLHNTFTTTNNINNINTTILCASSASRSILTEILPIIYLYMIFFIPSYWQHAEKVTHLISRSCSLETKWLFIHLKHAE